MLGQIADEAWRRRIHGQHVADHRTDVAFLESFELDMVI
jgi:hypothetical protein